MVMKLVINNNTSICYQCGVEITRPRTKKDNGAHDAANK